MRFYMAHPWTKMRKLLEEEYLCECLKGRVQYFNTRYRHVHDGMAGWHFMWMESYGLT